MLNVCVIIIIIYFVLKLVSRFKIIDFRKIYNIWFWSEFDLYQDVCKFQFDLYQDVCKFQGRKCLHNIDQFSFTNLLLSRSAKLRDVNWCLRCKLLYIRVFNFSDRHTAGVLYSWSAYSSTALWMWPVALGTAHPVDCVRMSWCCLSACP